MFLRLFIEWKLYPININIETIVSELARMLLSSLRLNAINSIEADITSTAHIVDIL